MDIVYGDNCIVSEEVQKEIYRIKEVARIYKDLKAIMPGYENEYLDAFVELAERFESVGAED